MFEIFRAPIEIKELRKQLAETQNSLSILIGDASTTSYTTGNPYADYKAAVKALADKYEGTARWGIQQVKNIIDVRSAFIIGQGLKITCEDKKKYSRELEFINEFVRLNNLDEEMPQDLAKEGEIEGKILVKLTPNLEKKQMEFRFISYSANGYAIETDADDYQKYIKASYKDTKKQSDVVIPVDDFVYKKFSGRISKVNEVMPKVAMVLRHIEDLDKALSDWRQINNFISAPTPYFKCANAAEAKSLQEQLTKVNWKIGKMLMGTAEFSIVESNGNGVTAIKEEIITLAKIISGATGVPVHFLGLPDLMSNRAVSTDLFEFINASTNKERHVWQGFYEELFDKVLLKANELYKFGFTTGKIKAQVLAVTEAKIKELVDIWMPLYTANIVDLDYVLSKIPDAEPDKIKKSLNDNALKMLEDIKRQEKEESIQ